MTEEKRQIATAHLVRVISDDDPRTAQLVRVINPEDIAGDGTGAEQETFNPYLWEPNVEQDLGNGVYGMYVNKSLNCPANDSKVYVIVPGDVDNIISVGGTVTNPLGTQSVVGQAMDNEDGNLFLSYITRNYNKLVLINILNNTSALIIGSYKVWVTYTKVEE